MAAALRQDAALSGSGSRRVLLARRGAQEIESRAGGVRRRARATARRQANPAERRVMIQTLRQAARMEAVQTPVIPVIADLIRSTPGTISLGQGIVSYGPPREAVEALAAFGG